MMNAGFTCMSGEGRVVNVFVSCRSCPRDQAAFLSGLMMDDWIAAFLVANYAQLVAPGPGVAMIYYEVEDGSNGLLCIPSVEIADLVAGCSMGSA
jgi:hypothetical protein